MPAFLRSRYCQESSTVTARVALAVKEVLFESGAFHIQRIESRRTSKSYKMTKVVKLGVYSGMVLSEW